MGKQPQSYIEKRHQQHQGPLKALCHNRIPAQTPQTLFFLHLNRWNRQIFAYPSVFSNKCCWSEEKFWFLFPENWHLESSGSLGPHLRSYRDCCDAAEGEQLEIPTGGSDPLRHTRKPNTPLSSTIYSKNVQFTLAPGLNTGLCTGSPNFLTSEQKQSCGKPWNAKWGPPSDERDPPGAHFCSAAHF